VSADSCAWLGELTSITSILAVYMISEYLGSVKSVGQGNVLRARVCRTLGERREQRIGWYRQARDSVVEPAVMVATRSELSDKVDEGLVTVSNMCDMQRMTDMGTEE